MIEPRKGKLTVLLLLLLLLLQETSVRAPARLACTFRIRGCGTSVGTKHCTPHGWANFDS
jgi:hypothetical protein